MAASQITWTHTADGAIVEDSPSWRAFTGQTYEEMAVHGFFGALHPDDRARTELVWTHCMATRSVYETTYRLRRADGAYRWMSVKGVPILGPDGAVREWIGANRDIHDSVMEQEGLAHSLDREQRQSALLAKVAGAARTLQTMLSSREIAILLQVARRDAGVDISVTDNGIGIDGSLLPQVFGVVAAGLVGWSAMPTARSTGA